MKLRGEGFAMLTYKLDLSGFRSHVFVIPFVLLGLFRQ